jgi:hypothetical protein
MILDTWDIIKKAIQMVTESLSAEPNCMFIAADVSTEYLHFYEIDYEFVEPVEAELNKLGVVFVGKYETLALKRGFLWDNRK